MADVGYIRVSSETQNTDRQLDGVALDKTFEDKASGKSTERTALATCLDYLREGDRLHVHSMDRLARNLVDLQHLVLDLTAQGITVKFHKENLEFTGEDCPMATLMLQIMGAVAQFERALIRERQAEGIKKALAKGIKFGRRPKLDAETRQQVVAMVAAGNQKAKVASHFNISRPTVYKILAAQSSEKATVS